MAWTIDRRKMLGSSLLATSGLASGTAFSALLSTPEAADRIYAVLKQQLQLGEQHGELVAAFTESLQIEDRYYKSTREIQALLQSGDEEQLTDFIVKTFVTSTNYIAYAAAKAERLSLIQA